MEPKVIDSVICTKTQLISCLEELNKHTPMDYERIQLILDDLKENLSFLVEYPYVDKHYRDIYNIYYSIKFSDFDRHCIRVHIFDKASLIVNDISNSKDLYCGYFIVRPLQTHPLGRSMINPRVLKNNNFISCLAKEKIHFLGTTLVACGFPHVAQDNETHKCAESALWALLTYFGYKYINYSPVLPSDILKKVSLYSKHKLLPSMGLTVDELAMCINNCGQNCNLYYLNENNASESYSILNIYIESGMPAILALGNGGDGHAVLAIGHKNIDKANMEEELLSSGEIWRDVSSFKKEIVLIDDNRTPFSVVPIDAPSKQYKPPLNDLKIKAFIVPIHREMFLNAESMKGLLNFIFNDANFGLQTFGEHWITRLFLTTSNSYKEFLEVKSIAPDNIKSLLKRMYLPKFIWICEIYNIDDYKENKTSGIILFDATGEATLNSIIFYFMKNKRIIPRDYASWQGTKGMVEYKDVPYQNNLKGEWNSWKD